MKWYIILGLLLISSCVTEPYLPTENKALYKGKDAIVMNFIEGTPPDEVFENYGFRAGLNLENKGAQETAQGTIIVNYEEDYMDLVGENSITYSLEGRTLANIFGEKERFFFDFRAKNIDEGSTHHLSSIYISTCYKYQTTLTTDICIDTDLYNEKSGQKICEVSDISLSNQGAPVAVKNVHYEMTPVEDKINPSLNIYIDNVGSGQILSASATDKGCTSNALDREDDLNIIEVEAYLGDKKLDCTPNPFHLGRGRGYVKCILKDGISRNSITYLSVLKVILKYGYMQTISKKVDILLVEE